MKFVTFTMAVANNPPVYINPEQVVAVRQFPSSAHIFVTVPNESGGPSYYAVREKADEVVEMLISA